MKTDLIEKKLDAVTKLENQSQETTGEQFDRNNQITEQNIPTPRQVTEKDVEPTSEVKEMKDPEANSINQQAIFYYIKKCLFLLF